MQMDVTNVMGHILQKTALSQSVPNVAKTTIFHIVYNITISSLKILRSNVNSLEIYTPHLHLQRRRYHIMWYMYIRLESRLHRSTSTRSASGDMAVSDVWEGKQERNHPVILHTLSPIRQLTQENSSRNQENQLKQGLELRQIFSIFLIGRSSYHVLEWNVK